MGENFLSDIKLIIGLGNPGEEYALTRHNAGAMLLEYLRKQWNFPEFKYDKYANTLIVKGIYTLHPSPRHCCAGAGTLSNIHRMFSGHPPRPYTLIFPQTHMNESGRSVKYIMDKENIQPNQLLVLHDDKDFNFEEVKLQKDISSAGHKGVQSIIDAIETNNFWRLRIGIGPVPELLTTDVFVLQKFTPDETSKLDNIFSEAKKLIINS